MVSNVDDSTSQDVLFPGRLSCLQHKRGYRFSVDAVLLAHFVRPGIDATILDLGAGCGVISLLLSYRWPLVHLTCLEVQESLLALIRKNISLNSLADQIEVIGGDLCNIKELVAPASYDWLVCNPPYYKKGAGRCPVLEHEKAAARHEITLELNDVMAATTFALRPGGRAAFVFPAERSLDLLSGLRGYRLEPKRLQVVHSCPGGVGKLLLVEATKGGRAGVEILAPFYIFEKCGGEYSREMAAFFEP